jgi:hypothetical protein
VAKLLQDLMGDVRARIDEPVEDYFKNTEIISWLNEALFDLALELRLETIFEKTPLTSYTSIDLPADLVSIRSIYVNGVSYRIGTLDDRHKQSGNSCYLWGNRINFSTPVNGKYEIFYIRDPKRLVVATDVADIPDRYAHLPVIYAFSKAKEKDEEQGIAVSIMEEYLRLKFEMVNELKQKQMLEGNYFIEPYGGF